MNRLWFLADRALAWLTPIAMVASLYMAFVYAPTDRHLGEIQRIFYWHVATAWTAYLAFFVVFVTSILYLRTRREVFDQVAGSSAEIGVLFTTLVLLTGPIWGRPVWNAWWSWDPRLTTTLILWFLYVTYLIIRGAAEGEERRARLAAVFGIVAFADVPLVHMSVVWWRSLHPLVITVGRVNVEPPMLRALLVSVFAFTLLYAFLLVRRFRLEGLQAQVARLKGEARETDRPAAEPVPYGSGEYTVR